MLLVNRRRDCWKPRSPNRIYRRSRQSFFLHPLFQEIAVLCNHPLLYMLFHMRLWKVATKVSTWGDRQSTGIVVATFFPPRFSWFLCFAWRDQIGETGVINDAGIDHLTNCYVISFWKNYLAYGVSMKRDHIPIKISSLCSLWNLPERPSDGFRFVDISFSWLLRQECIPVARSFPFCPIGIRRRATRISGVRDRFGRRRGGCLALKVYSSNLYPSGFSLTPSVGGRDRRSLSRWLQLRDNGLVESLCCSLTDLAVDRTRSIDLLRCALFPLTCTANGIIGKMREYSETEKIREKERKMKQKILISQLIDDVKQSHRKCV